MQDHLIKSFDMYNGKEFLIDSKAGDIAGFKDFYRRLARVLINSINDNVAECFLIDRAEVKTVFLRELFRLNDDAAFLVKNPPIASKFKFYGIDINAFCGDFCLMTLNKILNLNKHLKYKFRQHGQDGFCLFAECNGVMVNMNAFFVAANLATATDYHIELLVGRLNYEELEKVCCISSIIFEIIQKRAK